MKQITAYQCEFCEKIYLSKQGAKNHEKRCWLNPARRSCATCSNLYRAPDDEGCPTVWTCQYQLHTPFKQKVTDCREWVENAEGEIFDDGYEWNRDGVIE